MNYKSDFNKTNRIVVIISIVLAVLLVILLASFGFCKILLGGEKIYDGIFVSGENLSGLTKSEAEAILAEKFKIDNENTLTLSCEGYEVSFPVSEIEPNIDYDATAFEAFNYARQGKLLDRVKKVLDLKENPKEIPFMVTFNDEALFAYTDKLTLDAGQPMEELSSSLSGNTLTIIPGKPGLEINRNNAKAAIGKALANDKYFTQLTLEDASPTAPTVDEIYDRFHTEVKDASFELVDNVIEYTDAQTGIDFDKLAVEEALKNSGGKEFSFEVVVTSPSVTVDELKSKMFRDLLATYSSKYNEGVVGRSHNVKLASKYINGTILLPGDVFSYNDTVGPRTLSRGFKEANVYVGNEVETGVGGGICQVSSTLFNSVVMSGLEIVTRTSHSLPVSYVPAGRDATVSYGSIDFKFSNPYDMPVKIVSSASGGVNTVSIYGTNENPGRKISFETELIKTIPYTIDQKEDATLPTGTVKVESKGAYGSSYNTYKVIVENGAVVSRSLLTRSTYNPTTQKELIGTAPIDTPSVETNTLPEDTDVSAPEQSSEPESTTPEASGEPENDETQTESEIEQNKPAIKPISPSVGEID